MPEKTANSSKVEKTEKPKAQKKRNNQSKINKYGFIHIDAKTYKTLNLPKKTDVPIDLKVDAEARTILITIK
ncbi:hypothetical protein E3J74_03555 [Candidatus Bathyarchaeota archaeon]|nr:MAG: hypothetical protein E3J74_03555 [Candidatus Bathyarchaeota archaeon]